MLFGVLFLVEVGRVVLTQRRVVADRLTQRGEEGIVVEAVAVGVLPLGDGVLP